MINDFFIYPPCSFNEALEKIGRNCQGIIFLLDEHQRLLGSLSDGDIRRAIIKNGTISGLISIGSDFYNRHPSSLPINCSPGQIWQLLGKGLRAIPLLDDIDRVADIATRERIRRIPISEPMIGSQEILNVNQCLRSGWVSSQGSFITEFEESFSQYLGGGFSVAVSNGTVALQLSLEALGIGAGDEVLVPNLTFAASINAVIHSGATPKLVDIDKVTWGMSLESISKAIGPNTKAIMPVHLYGQPVEIDLLYSFARENHLLIIEDCAESLGATYKNRLVGLEGDCSCFSFFANKVITTGEGGMICFKDRKIAEKAKILRDHGMSKVKKYWHELAGHNFRMTNIQAAIGVAQLARIEDFREAREKIFNMYDQFFHENERVITPQIHEWSTNSYWLYTILIKDISEVTRDEIIQKMMGLGIDVRPGFYPLHQMPTYVNYSTGEYPNSSEISQKAISLPTSIMLKETDVQFIADSLLKCV